MTENRTLTGVFVSPSTRNAERVSIPDTLDALYDLLDCRLVDFVVRYVGGKRVGIILDDEGLLIDDPLISAVTSRTEPMLYGNLFIVRAEADDEGHWLSLTDAECNHVLRHTRVLPTRLHPEGVIALYPCDYTRTP